MERKVKYLIMYSDTDTCEAVAYDREELDWVIQEILDSQGLDLSDLKVYGVKELTVTEGRRHFLIEDEDEDEDEDADAADYDAEHITGEINADRKTGIWHQIWE